MELRSQRTNESKDLQATLMNLGFYEDGMNLSEMRNMMSALQESVNETDIDRAVKENELDWNDEGQLFSSTTIQQCNEPSQISCSEIDTACSECRYDVVVTQAIVHHSMNWSPNQNHLKSNETNKKILCSSIREECNNDCNQSNDNNGMDDGDNMNNNDGTNRHRIISIKLNDSGVNLSRELENDVSMSSITEQSTSTMSSSLNDQGEYPLQASTSSVAISDPSSYTQKTNDDDENGEPSR